MRKRFLLFVLGISAAHLGNTTVRTVSNNPTTIAQFNTIQAAVNSSSDGDTVYIQGSPNLYSSFDLTDKRLTIIGPGWSPDKNIALVATVNGMNMHNTPAAGSPTGSEIQGLIFNGSVQQQFSGGDGTVDNITFRRCQFNNTFNFNATDASGLLIEGCAFFHQLFFGSNFSYQNILFQNNIFYFQTCCISNQIFDLFNCVNVRFDHNLFTSGNNNASNTVQVFANSNRFLSFTNNIFNQANVGSGINLSTFTNNITNNTGLNPGNATANATPWAVNSNVDGGGNVSNQSPQMASQTTVDAGGSSLLQDFTIAAGPANNAGSDGKDMGLLFDGTGGLNWANSRNSRLPRIFSMNITNPTVAAGNNLSVNVTAKTSN